MLGYQIDYITIIDIEREKESNPYIKSLKFIKNIIMNLKEESRLFEVFLYLDSEVIENILIKSDIEAEGAIEVYGENNKLSKNPTEYGINMITVDEIINHLGFLMKIYSFLLLFCINLLLLPLLNSILCHFEDYNKDNFL